MESWMLDIMNGTRLVLDLELHCSENLTCLTSSMTKIKTDFRSRYLKAGLYNWPYL